MPGPEAQDEKRAPSGELARPGPGKAGDSSSVFADSEASNDLAELLDRTDRLLGTGPSRGSRASPGGQDRTGVQSAEVRDGDRLSAGTPGTMLDLLMPPSSVQVTDRETLPETEPTVPGGGPPPGAPSDDLYDLKQRVQDELLRRVNKHKASFEGVSDDEFRAKIREIVVAILSEPTTVIPPGWSPDSLLTELLHDFLGLGALEQFIADDTITEVMVNRPDQIYIERDGRLELTKARFLNEGQVRAVIQRIIQPLGRHVDESVPYVDARLADGSRVHAIIPPLAIDGAKITIRKFFKN